MSVSKEQWNEPEAIVLLQHAGKLVAGFKSTGVQIPNRLQYHARLVAAHDALRIWLLTEPPSTGTWRPPARPTGR
jgi:hypothetical protein